MRMSTTTAPTKAGRFFRNSRQTRRQLVGAPSPCLGSASTSSQGVAISRMGSDSNSFKGPPPLPARGSPAG